MYITNVNNKSSFNFYKSIDKNILKNKNESYTIKIKNENLLADIVSIDKINKQVVVKINQNKYTVNIKEPVDVMLDNIGIHYNTVKKINDLKAPMPGLVLKVLVKVGDEVKKGESLLLLEAMKMENVFKAPTDVKIKEIKIAEKAVVEKGQVLIVFE